MRSLLGTSSCVPPPPLAFRALTGSTGCVRVWIVEWVSGTPEPGVSDAAPGLAPVGQGALGRVERIELEGSSASAPARSRGARSGEGTREHRGRFGRARESPFVASSIGDRSIRCGARRSLVWKVSEEKKTREEVRSSGADASGRGEAARFVRTEEGSLRSFGDPSYIVLRGG